MPIELGGRYLTEKELKGAGFKSLGSNVRIHNRASLYGIENIRIGNNVRIDDYSVIIATGSLTIGNYVSIPNFCFLGAKFSIELHDFVTLAPGVKVFTSSDDYHGDYLTGPLMPPGTTGGITGKVILEKHVLVGAGSVILPNCIIQEGCSIGALSLVKNNLESWSVYAGIPVKRIGHRKNKLLQLAQLKELNYEKS